MKYSRPNILISCILADRYFQCRLYIRLEYFIILSSFERLQYFGRQSSGIMYPSIHQLRLKSNKNVSTASNRYCIIINQQGKRFWRIFVKHLKDIRQSKSIDIVNKFGNLRTTFVVELNKMNNSTTYRNYIITTDAWAANFSRSVIFVDIFCQMYGGDLNR